MKEGQGPGKDNESMGQERIEMRQKLDRDEE